MKILGTVAAVLAAGVAVVMVLLSVMTAQLLAAASASACVAPVGAVAPMGGPVRVPLAGPFTVTSEYGMRHNPGDVRRGEYRLHAGIDLQHMGGPGQVVAVSAGVVTVPPYDEVGGGNSVVVDHGAGIVTRYLHLAEVTVDTGEVVWAGRVLGIEGSTGNSSGRHLHLQVERAGQPVEPRGWFASQGVTVPPLGQSSVGPATVVVDPGVEQPLEVGPAEFGAAVPGPTQALVRALPASVGAWSGDQVVNAAHVIRAGQDRGLDARTVTIAVMTAMAESSLTNLDHGDAARGDTIGLFQEGPERGPYDQRMDPYGAASIFYDYLLRVPGYLELEPTIAAHHAQRNADPYHYEPLWPDAVLMVSTLTADPALLQDLPAGGPITGCEDGGPEPLAGTGDGSGQAIVEAATHYLGTPYSWGGGTITGPSLGIYTSGALDGTHTVGFDCSGLVQFAVHHATGLTLPHSAEAQGQDSRGAVVPRDWDLMQVGDVISFSQDGTGAPGSFGHVGIYLGDGRMIHTPRPGRSVEVVELRGSSYYEPMVWSIRRYSIS